MRRFVLMDGTPGAAGGGDPTPPVPPTATPPATPPAGDPPAPPSALAPTPAPPAEFIPEKFRVMNGEALDVEASARKMAESYNQLQARMGTGDVPPKDAGEYTITVPDAFKESFVEDDRTKAFRTDALAAGLTQKQFDFVMGKYFAVAPELVTGAIDATVETTRGALEKAWGPEYGKQLDAAALAFDKFADPADKGKFDSLMTDPALAYRILAKIGPELREAGGIPPTATGGGGENMQALMMSEANTNPRHPDHAATRARINAFYEKKYGTAPVT